MESSTKDFLIKTGITITICATLYFTKDKWLPWFKGAGAPTPSAAPKTAGGGKKPVVKNADGDDSGEYDEAYDSFNAAGAGASFNRPAPSGNKPRIPRWLRGFGGRPGTNHGDGQFGGVGVGIPISDARTKKNIALMADGMETIMKLSPCEYDYKTSLYPSLPDGKQNGLIAQELQEVAPHLVSEMEVDGEKVLAVNYQGVIPFLIKGMQEQQREINALKSLLN